MGDPGMCEGRQAEGLSQGRGGAGLRLLAFMLSAFHPEVAQNSVDRYPTQFSHFGQSHRSNEFLKTDLSPQCKV